jgi:hypothetical protein
MRASAALVFYHLAYDLKRFKKLHNFGALKFVGRFEFASQVWTPWHLTS